MSNQGLDTPGAVLHAAREAQGYQLREVADALNLPMHVIEAIEQDDAERLPAHVFARGYVRAYAKYLGVDPEPLVAALAVDQSRPPQEEAPIKEVKEPLPSAVKNGLIGVVGVLVVGLVIGLWLSGGDDEPAQNEAAVAVEDTAVEPQPGTTSTPENTPDIVAAADDPAPEESVRQAALPVPADDPDAAAENLDQIETVVAQNGIDVTPVDTPTAAPVASSVRQLNEGVEQLELRFTEDCWVEIRNTEGTTLFADLGRAGRGWTFAGQGPFRIRLGYAPGAMLYFNGELIALAPHTRNNIASLVLGQ